MKQGVAVALAASVVVLACAEPAKVPVFPANADEGTREELYDYYRLKGDIGFFDDSWKRRDGEYSWGQLESVARQFPESEAVYDRANDRRAGLIGAGMIGGMALGGTFVYSVAAPADDRPSPEAQHALYAAGAGIIGVALLVQFFWEDPADDFADVYNRALRHQLGLPEPFTARAARVRSAKSFRIEPMGADSIGFHF